MRMFIFVTLLLIPTLAGAFVAVETDISEPYEIVPIVTTLPEQVSFLGTLNTFPVMYEITSEEPFTFTAQLAQPTNQSAQPFSLLLVRRNDRGGGVTEVARQTVNPADWVRYRDRMLGLALYESPLLSNDVEPGTYRLEVSSPDNQGQFLLTIGETQQAVDYTQQLGYIRQTQQYFGYGFFSMLQSSLVYYPIGIVLLLGAFAQTYRFARRRTQPMQTNA